MIDVKTLKICLNDQEFILHPSGAAYWVEKQIVLIADVHLGKVTHFRKHGSAVPQESIYQNFKQLTEVIHYFQPKTVCFLGDLFHSHLNKEWLLFSDWIRHINCKVVLISGNHDIIPNALYNELSIAVVPEWEIDGFLLTHFPEVRVGCFNFSGHIHPGVKLQGFGKQFIRVSCFYRTKHQMVFPAFGNFTGKFIIRPKKEDHIYVVTDDEVLEMLT